MSELKNKNGLTEKEYLEQYDGNKYESPSVTVDMLIFSCVNVQKENYRKLPEKELKVLLVKRGDHPYIGQWALPGGFVNIDESLEDGAQRELKEETGLDGVYMEQLYTWGEPQRDPRKRIISVSYMALADSSKLNIEAGDDAEEAVWFSVKYDVLQEIKTNTESGYINENIVKMSFSNTDKSKNIYSIIKTIVKTEGKSHKYEIEIIKNEGIAFDHSKIIAYALERLRNKIEYTDIAFNLMGEVFTLTELQQVYETILGRELLKANFRRKIADMVIETDDYLKAAGHRPSRLYKFNINHVQEKFN